ncbi:hypothetical protein ACFLZP_00230 [Patescibacteria group bacterium]
MKKILKKIVILTVALLPLIGLVTPALAENDPLEGGFNLTPPGQFGALAGVSLPAIVRSLLVLAMVLASLIAFGFLIFGGIIWITSGGDKQKTEQARNTITAALVGLLIVFASWAIIQLVQMFFGVSILQLNIEPLAVTGS